MINKIATRLWILGLGHSGTTVFWRMFRKDSRFTCFDEPLTSSIGMSFPNNNVKRTFNEYIDILGSRPRTFWDLYSPIQPLQELDSNLTERQKRYLRYLLTCSAMTVIDEIHLHMHVAALADLTPDAYMVHLYRRASAFTTSHLRPSWPKGNGLSRNAVRAMRHVYNQRAFWSRYEFPAGIGREDVIGAHRYSKFGLLLEGGGYDADRIMRSSALVRLLAYWHYHYHYLTREGAHVFGDRFRNVAYEAFAFEPDRAMRDLYEWIGVPAPAGASYAEVHPPKPAYRPSDKRWREAAVVAGFSEDEIRTLL